MNRRLTTGNMLLFCTNTHTYVQVSLTFIRHQLARQIGLSRAGVHSWEGSCPLQNEQTHVVGRVVESQLHPDHFGITVPRDGFEVAGPDGLSVDGSRNVHLFKGMMNSAGVVGWIPCYQSMEAVDRSKSALFCLLLGSNLSNTMTLTGQFVLLPSAQK